MLTARSSVVWFAVAVLVVDCAIAGFGLSRSDAAVRTQWDSLGLAPLIVGPVLAGAGAWLIRRNRTRLRGILRSSPGRAERADVSVVLALAAVSAAAHLVASALLWAVLGLQGEVLTGLWLVTQFGAIGVLWGMLAIGVLVGVLIPSLAAPYLVGLLCLGIPMVWSKVHLSSLFLITGGGTLTSPEFEFVPRSEVIVAQFAVGMGALLLAAAVTTFPGRVFFVLLAAGALLFAPSAWLLQSTTPTRFWADTASLDVTCDVGRVTVCVPDRQRREGQILATQIKRMNLENARVPGFSPVILVRAVSFGMIQRQAQSAPSNEQWITVTDLGRVPSWDFLIGHMEQIAFPTRCFTPAGPPAGALAESSLMFTGYQSVIAAGLDPAANPSLRPVTALSTGDRDAWLAASWAAVYMCQAAPDLPVP